MQVGDRVTWTTRPCSGVATVYVGRVTSVAWLPQHANVSVPHRGQRESHRVALARLTVTDVAEGATKIMTEPKFPPVNSVWRRQLPQVVGSLGTATGYEQRTVRAIDREKQTVTWWAPGLLHTGSLRAWKQWAKAAEQVTNSCE